MNESRRVKRIIRHHKRSTSRAASLNMVSLMDIFTILVFFLLVTSSDSEILPTPKAIKLPESIAEKNPKQTLVVMVNERDIRINNKVITNVPQALNDKASTIPALAQALKNYRDRKPTRSQPINKQAVTIMGDKAIPYRLLKKIMLTCASNKFTNISLAVVKKHKSGAP